MTTVTTVCAAVVPVLINIGDSKLWPTMLSLLVTVIVGIEGVFHFREHWRNYDLIESYLKQEKFLFLAGSGIYKTRSCPAEALAKFVERVEAEISRERAETIDMRTATETDGQNDSE